MKGVSIKISGLIRGVIVIGFGIFFSLFIFNTFESALLYTSITTTNWLYIWLFESVVPIVVIEWGIWLIKHSLAIDLYKIENEKIESGSIAQLASRIAQLSRYEWIPTTIIFLLIAVVFITNFLKHNSLAELVTKPDFSIVILTFFVYFFIVRKYFLKQAVKILRFFDRALPSYILEEDGILLDFNIKNLSNMNKKYIVKILFAELDEVKVLSYVEAESLLRYKIGPDISLRIETIKDGQKYLKGEISKPRYYVYDPTNGVESLLLRGPNIFYLFTVGNQNNIQLIDAFRTFKQKNGSNPIPSKLK